MNPFLQQIITSHREAVEKSFAAPQTDLLEKISVQVVEAIKSSHKILLCGNGGSAADAQHLAAEFIGRFKMERASIPAMALTTDTSILTSLANDYTYDRVFSRQIEGLGIKGDILMALSTSGNSPNVLEAVSEAKLRGLFTIGWTGADGGKLAQCTDLCFRAQSRDTSTIQEIHITALHAVAAFVENSLAAS